MKLSLPVCLSRALTAFSLSLAASLALATLAPASTAAAKEPVVNIEATNATTGYQEAPGIFTITLSEKQDKPVTVFYIIEPSSSPGYGPVNGVDYSRLSGMKVIKAGTTHALIRVVPTQASDSLDGGFGLVDLKLRKGAGYTLGADKKATVTISIVLP